MKKVGLITFHDTTNFGSLLQTYGLYRKVNELGYYCEVVDYQCRNIVERELPQPLEWKGSLKVFLKDSLKRIVRRRKYSQLHRFLLSNMHVSPGCDRNTLSEIRDRYDKYLIGSDITWGMDVIGQDTTFFLDFEQDSRKKTAFAASAGNPWAEEHKNIVGPLLKDFDFIAVREDETAEWVEELTGSRPKVVCDPTMLITSDEWKKFCSPRKEAGKYVLVYFDNNAGDCLASAKKYARKYGLKVKLIGYGRPRRDVDVVRPYSVEDFLSLINDAAFVVTASYHGMLFSTYFNKDFAYFNRAHKSRMNTLANRLGVIDREGGVNDVLEMGPVDFDVVNQKVEDYRKDSMDTLSELLAR